MLREAREQTRATSSLAENYLSNESVFSESGRDGLPHHQSDGGGIATLQDRLEEALAEASAAEESAREAERELREAQQGRNAEGDAGAVPLPSMGQQGWSVLKARQTGQTRSLASGVAALSQGQRPWWALRAPSREEMKGLNTEVYTMQKALLESPKKAKAKGWREAKASLEQVENAWYQVTAVALASAPAADPGIAAGGRGG